jgi:hypothetical protein
MLESEAARLRGYGAEVNDEARGGSRQTFAQRTELGAKSR